MGSSRRVRSFLTRGRARVAVAASSLAASALGALATPPDFPAVTLPVDGASIVSSIIAIGVTVLLLGAAAVIGFMLARKLISRLKRAI